MGNSNQQPNKNTSTQTPKRDEKKENRPGQATPNTGNKNPNQK